MKISMTVLKLLSGYDFETNISKGHYSAKNIAKVTVLIFYMLSDAALYLFHVS